MSIPADDKRWAIAPPSSSEAESVGEELAIDESLGQLSSGRRARPRPESGTRSATGPTPPRSGERLRGKGTASEAAAAAEHQEGASSQPSPSSEGVPTSAPGPRDQSPKSSINSLTPGSREGETLAPEGGPTDDDEERQSRRDGADTIPAPSNFDELG